MLKARTAKPSANSALSAAVLHGLRSVQTAVNANQTIAEAIEELRSRTIEHPVIYVYAVDDDDRLMGQVSMRALLLSSPTARIHEVMTRDVVPVSMDTSFDDALEKFAKSKLLALPVVDGEGHLVGAIDVEQYARESLERAEHERVRQVFLTLGLHIEHAAALTPWESFRMRMPWLSCNIVGGILCALIAWRFEHLLQSVVLLAFFLPLVLTLSESIAMQALTLTVGSSPDGKPVRSPWRLLRNEAFAATLLAIVSGVVVALVSLLWGIGPVGGFTMFASVSLSMIFASIVGGSVPMILHAMRLDPSVAAGPVTLVIADTITTLAYLSLGLFLLP
jgi:magnesium transporter